MMALSVLAASLMPLGDDAGARTAVERALEIATELGDARNAAPLHSQLALLAGRAGDSERALALYDEAVQLAEVVGDPQTLAAAHLDRGRHLHARSAFEEAEADYLAALGLDVVEVTRAQALGSLGNVRLTQGRWHEARLAYQEVLDTARDLGDATLEAAALEMLSVFAFTTGDLRLADERLIAALDRLGDGDDKSTRARIRFRQAWMHQLEGDHEQAHALYEECCALADASGDRERLVWALGNMATLDLDDLGRPAEGLAHATRQLESARAAGMTAEQAHALTTLADARLVSGELDEAADLAAQAILLSDPGLPERLTDALSIQAEVALARGDADTARGAIAEARRVLGRLPMRELGIEGASLTRAREPFARVANIEQDALAAALRGTAADDAGGGSAAAARQALLAEGFVSAGRAQARALLEGIAEHRSGGRDARSIALRHTLRGLRADRESALVALGAARSRGTPADDLQVLRGRARALDAAAGEVLLSLRDHAPVEAEFVAPEGVGPERARRALLYDGAVLVQFAEGLERLYAYVLTDDGLAFHDLGELEAIARLATEQRDLITDPLRLGDAAAVARNGGALWSALLAPLLPSDAAGRLILVPSPVLSTLSFDALVTNAPDRPQGFADIAFVIDRFEVSLGPSVPVLCLLEDVGPRAGDQRTLVLADPIVPGEVGEGRAVPRTVAAVASLPRLPGTRSEALGIARLLQAVADGDGDGADVPLELPQGRDGVLRTTVADVFLGADATTACLREDPQRYSVLHFAAHGAVQGGGLDFSGLVLTPAGEDDDGFLSVPEIMDLVLDADLVVLSSCDTARGDLRRGEGVQSVARAFLYAGARMVVASLWQVDDRETEQTMGAFYAGLHGDGLSPVAALRRARLAMRHAPAQPGAFAGTGRGKLLPGVTPPSRPTDAAARHLAGHPYFWAPFVPIGLPR
jgi:tetratricopeptide (TPR) repeat protein